MNDIERDEINKLPSKYRPLGAWAYFGYSILFIMLQPVGFILVIVFSCIDTNINRRSFARSFLCIYVILGIIIGIIILLLFSFGLLGSITKRNS